MTTDLIKTVADAEDIGNGWRRWRTPDGAEIVVNGNARVSINLVDDATPGQTALKAKEQS